MQTATLIGATGLIGSHLLELLLNDDSIGQVRILVRRPLETGHPKLQVTVIDFSDLAAIKEGVRGSNAVLCAVGTTRAKVKGDMAAYRRVDFDIPVNAARCCAETGVPQFLLVSSVGADSQSGNFYLKLKGEAEEGVRRFDIPSIAIFRPSMLLGKRTESRPMEAVAQALSKPLSFLFPSKYKPIRAKDVARAMIAASRNPALGARVLHFGEMKGLLM